MALDDPDPMARSTADDPDRLTPHSGAGVELMEGDVVATLRPVSWTLLRFQAERG